VQVWYSPDRRQSAVLTGRWKAVWMLDTLRLFDVAGDPGETTDLAAREPRVVAQLDSIRRAEDQRVRHTKPPARD
jgi:arylsulfatase A-like enzyme